VILLALLLQAQVGRLGLRHAALRFVHDACRHRQSRAASRADGYRATAETEFGFILRDSLGRESVGQIEQLAARAEWDRGGRYDLHVVGYRAQSLGAPYSALTFTRMYTVPTLYGSRLAIGMTTEFRATPRTQCVAVTRFFVAACRKRIPPQAGSPIAPCIRCRGPRQILPLHRRRHRGNDSSAGRRIRVVRVNADLTSNPAANFVGFQGELDFDADRFQLCGCVAASSTSRRARTRCSFVVREQWLSLHRIRKC